MAFSKVLVLRKEVMKGVLLEKYTWNGAGVVTSGPITPDVTDAEGYGTITNILFSGATDDTTTNGVSAKYDNNILSSTVTLTFTAADVGSFYIVGLVS